MTSFPAVPSYLTSPSLPISEIFLCPRSRVPRTFSQTPQAEYESRVKGASGKPQGKHYRPWREPGRTRETVTCARSQGPGLSPRIRTVSLPELLSTLPAPDPAIPSTLPLDNLLEFSSGQFSRSVVSDSLRPHESQHARPPCPSLTPGVHSNSMSIESVMPSNHLILCRPLLLLPPIPPSIRVFPNESTLRMRWPKYWSFSFSSEA